MKPHRSSQDLGKNSQQACEDFRKGRGAVNKSGVFPEFEAEERSLLRAELEGCGCCHFPA